MASLFTVVCHLQSSCADITARKVYACVCVGVCKWSEGGRVSVTQELLEQGAVRGVPQRRGIDRGVNKKAREE